MNDYNRIGRRDLLEQVVGAAGLAAALASVDAARAQSQPAGGERRVRVRDSFDFGWKFFRGDAPGAQQPDFADAAWKSLDLPHDWSIEGPFGEKEPAAGPGGYLPTGIGWYRKRFRLAESDRDRRVVIEFDGVYQNGEVWINGQYLGKRPYGYIGFSYDITPHVHFGSGENVIAVKADNSQQPNCRWYSGSGIYRHTWLRLTNQLHVATWGTFVNTPQVTKDVATVRIRTRVRNEGRNAADCTLETSVLDREGKVAGTAQASQGVTANGEYEFAQQVGVDKPDLWSVDNPYLYTVRSTLRGPGGILDVYDTPMGIREAVFDADKGFLLNGERVKINGVCLHHEAGPVGTAVPVGVWERRLGILKRMGCNGIRTSHNPFAPEFLDLCDSMGFLVMNEFLDEWKVPKPQTKHGYNFNFDEWSERDATDFIHRDRNRPAVVLWSAGNEVGDQTAPNGVETLRRLLGIFHREDPTRFVTVACDRIAAEPRAATPEFLELLDVVGYNYVDRWRDRAEKYYSDDRHAFPGRRFIGTENGGAGGVRGSYGGLLAGASADLGGFAGRGGSRPNVNAEQLWKFESTYDYVSGDFMWTGIDYLGEARWPGKGSSAGVIDSCGFEKDGYYFYQSQWTKEPMVHLFPHWNWKGREGQLIPVFVYTNCDSVELFINGRSAGVQGYQFPRYGMEERYGNSPRRGLRTTSDLHLSWTVPWEPGTLRAVGSRDGKKVVDVEVATTGEAAAIELKADREVIRADRRDVGHVTVRIVDAQGRMVPDAAHEVTFEVQGEGRLIGLDDGDMQSHENYKATRRKAFNGMCLAIVQSGARAGAIRVAATAPGLKGANLVVTART